jgi:hypothetical protein
MLSMQGHVIIRTLGPQIRGNSTTPHHSGIDVSHGGDECKPHQRRNTQTASSIVDRI